MALTRGFASKRARTAGDRSPASTFNGGLLLSLVLCLFGLSIGLVLTRIDGDAMRAVWPLMTFSMYRDQDTLWFAVLLAILVWLAWAVRDKPAPLTVSLLARWWPDERRPAQRVALIALAVLLLVGAGTFLAHHGMPYLSDEFFGAFQAAIFAEGQLLAPVPEAWREFHGALQPYFTVYDAEHDVWGSAYRPGFAALRAVFGIVGLDALINTVLTALSVVLVAAVARQLWPDRPDAAVLAAVLLATSPQVLITGMTGFAWPAHLCLNLLWVWLFLRGGAAGHALAALVGVVAVGQHQVHVHVFFVLPFMLALLRQRRWTLAGFYAVVYGAALFVWVFWFDIALLMLEPVAGDAGAAAATAGLGYLGGGLALIGSDGLLGPPLMGINLLRLLAWLNPAVLVLLVVGVRPWGRLPSPLKPLVLGCLVSLVPLVLIMPNQMYGWGYRYAHGLLGSLVLLAVHGWVRLSADRTTAILTVKRVVGGLTVLALLVGVPLRTLQVRQFVTPELAAARHIQSLDADLVVVDTAGLWFWAPLVRNDPFLRNRPLMMAMQSLSPDQMTNLCRDRSFVLIDAYDLSQFGVKRVERSLGRRAEAPEAVALRAIATSPRCAGRIPPAAQ